MSQHVLILEPDPDLTPVSHALCGDCGCLPAAPVEIAYSIVKHGYVIEPEIDCPECITLVSEAAVMKEAIG